jgi:putative flippase GtrA
MRWLHRLWDDERIRYLMVGGWNTLFSYVLYLVLLQVFAPLKGLESSDMALVALIGRNYFLVISWLGWVISVPQSTLTMKYFAFRKGGKIVPQIFRAYMVYLPALGLGSAILWVLVQVLHFSPPIAAALNIVITTVFSYIGHKYFTFRQPLEVGEVPADALMSEE